MNAVGDVEKTLDLRNEEFISKARQPLRDLSQYSTKALEWLMVEHYQFSFRNCEFLWNASQATAGFDTVAVERELIRNYEEESGHAAMYRAALMKVGVDVERREEFKPTTLFLDSIGELCRREPSSVLGTMFATEAAAIFEHQVFRDVSEEVIARQEYGDRGKSLVAFHDMHLGGVEQSHKDELGVFLRGIHADQVVVASEGCRPTVHPRQALEGGRIAIELMEEWWSHLFKELDAKRPSEVDSMVSTEV